VENRKQFRRRECELVGRGHCRQKLGKLATIYSVPLISVHGYQSQSSVTILSPFLSGQANLALQNLPQFVA
jgi:hypothetical protein